MTKNIKFFCTSHINIDYLNIYEHLNLIGCGPGTFDEKWKVANTGNNINYKYLSYADLTAHYWIWHNYIKKNLNNDELVSFSQYRRHWVNQNFDRNKKYSLKDFDSILLKEKKPEWCRYDSILPSPFVFKKKNWERLKDFDFFNKKVSIKKQMFNSLGFSFPKIYKLLLSYLPQKLSEEFDNYISANNTLSAHGMYISQPKTLDNYMSTAFSWYEKCEEIVDPITKKKTY